MQSFCRGFRCLKSHVNQSRAVYNCYSRIISFSSNSSNERLKNLTPTSIECLRQTCPVEKSKASFRRMFSLSHNGTRSGGALRYNAPFRSLTTAVHHEGPVEQSNANISSDIAHPPRIKFKRLDKTAKHIMNILDKEAVEKVQVERQIPDIRPGYIIQLKVEVPENKRRVSMLKGIVIAKRNAGLNTTFRLRRLVAGVGVESVFPLYSPNIKEMKVLDKKKVRRAKLYYLRDRMNALKK